jgi:hypothetical protein
VSWGKILAAGVVAGIAYALGEKLVDVAWTKVFPSSPCGCGGGGH